MEKPRDDTPARGLDPEAVCTLPPDGLAERRAWIGREILPHAIETARLRDGLAVELEAAPGLAASLDRLVELERACCSGIEFRRAESARPDRLRLEILGIDPDASLFAPLLAKTRKGWVPAAVRSLYERALAAARS